MSLNKASGKPETSRELQGIDTIISNLRAMFAEALTPNMEKLLREMKTPTLKMLERLLNPNTNGTREIMMHRLFSALNK